MTNHYHGQKNPLIIIASVASILSFIPLKSFFKKLSIFDPIFLKFALIKSVILFFFRLKIHVESLNGMATDF